MMMTQDAPRDGSDIDPDLRRFMDINAAAYAALPPIAGLPLPEARKIFEAVRERWRTGGPVMAATREFAVESRHGSVRLRIHEPEPGVDRPALLYLHGGGWTIFSIDTHDRLMREYAARAGVVVIGVDYALSPEAKFPVALEQVVDVVGWVTASASELGIDPARLAIGGDSAGGNLSIAACLSLRDAGRGQAISAMVLNYPVTDRRPEKGDCERYGGPAYMLTTEEMDQFWVNYLARAEDAQNPLANPALAELTGLPPTFIAIAECDLLAGQGAKAGRRLEAAGVAVRTETYVGACHSFLEAVSIAPIADRALAEAAAWLAEQLAKRSV